MPAEIRAIVFDMDDTLLDRDETMLRFLRAQHRRFGLMAECEVFCQSVLHYQLGGYGDKLLAYQNACRDVGLPRHLGKELYDEFIENYGDDSVLIDGVKEVLDALCGKIALGMVTNGRSRSQRGKIKGAGLERYFDVIKVSGEEGVDKPEAELFYRCLQELGCQPDEVLFVGDHPVNDVEGAAAVGMRTVWVETGRYAAPSVADLTVLHVREIFEPDGVSTFGVDIGLE